MTEEELTRFAEQNFPRATEKLAELLGVEVEYESFGCDGWCLQVGNYKSIVISNRFSEVRQRFTLAHELGHLVLDIPSVVGESSIELQRSLSQEENRVNDFAAALLLPIGVVKQLIPEIPITALTIKKIAKSAGVSELFVARRLASLSSNIGLITGIVIFYDKGVYGWHSPRQSWLTPEFAQDLYDDCMESNIGFFKFHREDKKDVIFASIIENPYMDNITVLLQLITEENGLRKSKEERRRELEKVILQDREGLKHKMEGYFSCMRGKIAGLSLDEAVTLFNSRYLRDQVVERWDKEFNNRLLSLIGQEYIRLRLSLWIKR